jgi:hypothetical protein
VDDEGGEEGAAKWKKDISINDLLDSSYDNKDSKCKSDDDDFWKILRKGSDKLEGQRDGSTR